MILMRLNAALVLFSLVINLVTTENRTILHSIVRTTFVGDTVNLQYYKPLNYTTLTCFVVPLVAFKFGDNP